MELKVFPFDLSLRYPFAISRHTYYSMKTFIIQLSEGGYSGYGEATTNPYYGITEDNLSERFKEAGEIIANLRFENPAVLWEKLYVAIGSNSFSLSAVDCAAHDLYGKIRGDSFRTINNIPNLPGPMTSYTLGIGDISEIKRKINDLDWPLYKLKIGSKNDKEIINSIRKMTKSGLRVDANCAWNPTSAPEMDAFLAASNIEFIEQPFSAESWEESGKLKEISNLPIIADESCQREEDLEKCAGNFDGINIKLAKCGGLTPALRMITNARDEKLKIMIGCMTESSVAISAAIQLLPLADFADLDGPLLLAEDVAEGLTFSKGRIEGGQGNGFGVKFINRKFATLLPK